MCICQYNDFESQTKTNWVAYYRPNQIWLNYPAYACVLIYTMKNCLYCIRHIRKNKALLYSRVQVHHYLARWFLKVMQLWGIKIIITQYFLSNMWVHLSEMLFNFNKNILPRATTRSINLRWQWEGSSDDRHFISVIRTSQISSWKSASINLLFKTP